MTAEACLCGRCAPFGVAAQCSACGQEVRRGWRDGRESWLHRDSVGHMAVHGHWTTVAAVEEIRRQREDVARQQDDGTTYTSAEYEILRDKDATRRRRRLAELHGEERAEEVIPEPELRRTPVDVDDLPPRSGMRQIANLVLRTDGWELARLTRARGPYLGSDGSVLSISDSLVLGARGPEGRVAVATWRDGKFDSAYTGRVVCGVTHMRSANATELKSWIKETA